MSRDALKLEGAPASARLRLVVLGLSLSSSWGNGHATTYRALLRAFAERGHDIVFLERDVPWYADHRDLARPDFCELRFYRDLSELEAVRDLIGGADAVIVGSYVPDGLEVGRFVTQHARGATAFYDIDTPVTLASLLDGSCKYLSRDLIPAYDLYLSFTGGPTLGRLERDFGAKAAHALYCSVDADAYRPLGLKPRYDLGYLGTYSADRQGALERLLIEPARRAPAARFVVAGAQYPRDIAWPPNVTRLEHVGPAEHPAFYAAQRFTLNLTRADMIRAGWSPSVRLFEAAACGTPILSDRWPGLGELFVEGEEIVTVASPEDVIDLLAAPPERARAIGAAGRSRVLAEHTSRHRAAELDTYLGAAISAKAMSSLAISKAQTAGEPRTNAFFVR